MAAYGRSVTFAILFIYSSFMEHLAARTTGGLRVLGAQEQDG